MPLPARYTAQIHGVFHREGCGNADTLPVRLPLYTYGVSDRERALWVAHHMIHMIRHTIRYRRCESRCMLMRKVQRTLDKQSASLEKTMLQLVGVSRPAVSHYLCEIDTHCH